MFFYLKEKNTSNNYFSITLTPTWYYRERSNAPSHLLSYVLIRVASATSQTHSCRDASLKSAFSAKETPQAIDLYIACSNTSGGNAAIL